MFEAPLCLRPLPYVMLLFEVIGILLQNRWHMACIVLITRSRNSLADKVTNVSAIDIHRNGDIWLRMPGVYQSYVHTAAHQVSQVRHCDRRIEIYQCFVMWSWLYFVYLLHSPQYVPWHICVGLFARSSSDVALCASVIPTDLRDRKPNLLRIV